MSTLQEIKTAIEHLSEREKAMLKAQLFAAESEPDPVELEAALDRGLGDVEAGRVRRLSGAKIKREGCGEEMN